MVVLRVTLLGGFDTRLAAGGPLNVPNKKAQALLAYLGWRPGQPHQRDKLAALLWGERSDEQARDGLRHALAALRKALPDATPPILLVDGPTLALDPAQVEVDVATFERRVADGTVEGLAHAVELYRGDLLLGFSLSEPLFEDWLVAERERLRETALEVLARLLAHQTKTAVTEGAIQTAVRLLGLDPLQEPVHRTLMRLYARQGRRGAALKQYQVCVAALQRELGAEPEAETRRLYQELLRRPAPATRAPGLGGDDRARPARLAARARVELPAGETPLFGREGELGRLRGLLEEALHGRGHVAIVTGEAGVGKTRLLATLATEAVDWDCRVLIGRGHESESILPFGPWVDACRTGEVGPDEEAVAALGPAWRAELSRLLPDVATPGLPPPSDSDLRLFESVAQLMEQLAARRPVVLLLEDLHWADEMSLRLLAFVSRRVRGWAGLVLASVRDEELAEAALARRILGELARQPATMPLALAPLSRPDITCLVQALARAGTAVDDLARLDAHVWVVSEGNPFVAIETVRALQEGSISQGSPRLPLPQRVRELVSGRLERLSDPARQLGGVAAVIGRVFDFPLVQRAAGLDDSAAAQAVEELVRHRIFRGTGERLDFTHDRIRAAAYAELVPPRRQLLHRRVGEAIETLHAADLEPHCLALGVHFRQGEVRDKAVRYLRQAGLQAVARSALPDARACFEQALDVLDALPGDPSTLEQGIEIRMGLRRVLATLGEVRRALDRLREAETLAQRLCNDRWRGRVYASMTNLHSLLGELDEALVLGTRALEIAGRLGDLSLRIWTTLNLEQAHYYRGEYERAVELAIANLAAVPADRLYKHFGDIVPTSIFDRYWLVRSLSELGRFSEAAHHEAEALRLAGPLHQAYAIGMAHFTAGSLHLLKGDWAEARPLIEHAIAAYRTGNIVLALPHAVASSAWVLAQVGEASEALTRLREGEELLERQAERGVVDQHGGDYHALGRAALLLGQLDEALGLRDRALKYSPSHAGYAAHALHLLGDIASHPERFDAERAEAHYRQALALAGPRGMRPLVAHCHLGLGKLYRRTGDRQRAQEHLTTATTMYREMDMRFWLEQAEAEMRAFA